MQYTVQLYNAGQASYACWGAEGRIMGRKQLMVDTLLVLKFIVLVILKRVIAGIVKMYYTSIFA